MGNNKRHSWHDIRRRQQDHMALARQERRPHKHSDSMVTTSKEKWWHPFRTVSRSHVQTVTRVHYHTGWKRLTFTFLHHARTTSDVRVSEQEHQDPQRNTRLPYISPGIRKHTHEMFKPRRRTPRLYRNNGRLGIRGRRYRHWRKQTYEPDRIPSTMASGDHKRYRVQIKPTWKNNKF